MSGRSYTVVFELDPSGWWVITVPKIKGCITQARSLAHGRRYVREALSLFVSDAYEATLKEDVRIPNAARAALAGAVAARKEAELQRRKASASTAKTARQLEKLGLSRRDAAELLGISHQRVQQLLRGA